MAPFSQGLDCWASMGSLVVGPSRTPFASREVVCSTRTVCCMVFSYRAFTVCGGPYVWRLPTRI